MQGVMCASMASWAVGHTAISRSKHGRSSPITQAKQPRNFHVHPCLNMVPPVGCVHPEQRARQQVLQAKAIRTERKTACYEWTCPQKLAASAAPCSSPALTLAFTALAWHPTTFCLHDLPQALPQPSP